MRRIFRTPRLTRGRIWLAFAVAVVADGLQLIAGPFGWAFLDQALDVIAMVVTSYLLGFHLLLLPTFVLEFIPLADLLPSWTGCVALLVSMRRREQAAHFPSAPGVTSLKNSTLSEK